MFKRAEFVIKFSVDLDAVPGWGDKPDDWIALATREFERQSHYNTKAEVVSVDVSPIR